MRRVMRVMRVMMFAGAALLFLTLIGAGALLIATDGDLLGFLQTTRIRLALANRADDLAAPAGTDTTPQRFTIALGQTPATIARNLAQQRLILDPDLFVDYVRLEGIDRQLEAGTYFLRNTQTIPQIAQTLTDSRNASITFTILPGQRIEEIADNIDANPLFAFSGADFLALVGPGATIDPALADWIGLPIGASLEGLLPPDTYTLPPDLTASGLRDTLLQHFRLRTEHLRQQAQTAGLSLYQAVILASIIEREAIHNDENPQIASVYRNRLAIGMTLDADPTVQYALNGARGTWWPQITQADYRRVQSRYNTYLHAGLPPGPIANPALSAIHAAIQPDDTDYLFFRARCDASGYHTYALTYQAHLANACP